jgi:hypothetical protein
VEVRVGALAEKIIAHQAADQVYPAEGVRPLALANNAARLFSGRTTELLAGFWIGEPLGAYGWAALAAVLSKAKPGMQRGLA